MLGSSVYLDNNSSTPLDPEVVHVMTAYLQKGGHANPSSVHAAGQEARQLLLSARDRVARAFQVQAREVLFTSSATEGTFLFLQSYLALDPNAHVISSTVEHACVYETLRKHTNVSWLSPGLEGAIRPEQVRKAISRETRLVCLMAANNETGVKTDVATIATICEEHGVLFFIDGVALFGKEPFVLPKGDVVFSISGHKIHGPKGVGALVMRRSVHVPPLILGGPQEFGLRAGTENLLGVVGLSKAVEITKREVERAAEKMRRLKKMFESQVLEALPCASINGLGLRTTNTSNICFHKVDGEALLMALDLKSVAVSLGSACSSGGREPSRTLLNMGLSADHASCSLRFSLSRLNTEEEINRAASSVIELVTSYFSRGSF